MQIIFWVSVTFLLAVPAFAQGTVKLSANMTLRYATVGGATKVTLSNKGHRTQTIVLHRDVTVAPKAQPKEVMLVGQAGEQALIVTDAYPSIPGGLAFCQAGSERFLRVLSLSHAAPEEMLRVKVESCTDNIELADGGLAWTAASSMLHIRWLAGPSVKGKPEELTLQIGAP